MNLPIFSYNMAPVLACFTFEANEAYLNDQSILAPALDLLAARKGALG